MPKLLVLISRVFLKQEKKPHDFYNKCSEQEVVTYSNEHYFYYFVCVGMEQ